MLALACVAPPGPETSESPRPSAVQATPPNARPTPPIIQPSPAIAQPTPPIHPADVLATKVSVGDFTGPVLELIEFLRWHHAAPLSFVEDADDPPVHLYLNNASVKELLDEMLSRRREYRLETILDRLVIYPVRPQYQRIVSNVHIVGVGRWEAAERYIKILEARFPEFRDFDWSYISGQLGGPGPVVTDPVTLRPRARVVEHLVQLLGDDRKLVLTIRSVRHAELRSGRRARYLMFDEITVRR